MFALHQKVLVLPSTGEPFVGSVASLIPDGSSGLVELYRTEGTLHTILSSYNRPLMFTLGATDVGHIEHPVAALVTPYTEKQYTEAHTAYVQSVLLCAADEMLRELEYEPMRVSALPTAYRGAIELVCDGLSTIYANDNSEAGKAAKRWRSLRAAGVMLPRTEV